ncbi:MAG: GYF domain-containing protein [Candidatus Obscuribacterales bacterium]|nr:GYF domain-containing protein [Candidatus Obscuribacterales bacterium]
MDWYYAQNNQQKGPISEEELKDLLSSGVISMDSLVWKKGLPNWTEAKKLPNFKQNSVEWFYVHNGKQHGPLTEDSLKEELRSGRLPADSDVWCDQMDDWTSANQLPLFAAVIPKAPPPVPKPSLPLAGAPPPRPQVSGGSNPQPRPQPSAAGSNPPPRPQPAAAGSNPPPRPQPAAAGSNPPPRAQPSAAGSNQQPEPLAQGTLPPPPPPRTGTGPMIPTYDEMFNNPPPRVLPAQPDSGGGKAVLIMLLFLLLFGVGGVAVFISSGKEMIPGLSSILQTKPSASVVPNPTNQPVVPTAPANHPIPSTPASTASAPGWNPPEVTMTQPPDQRQALVPGERFTRKPPEPNVDVFHGLQKTKDLAGGDM